MSKMVSKVMAKNVKAKKKKKRKMAQTMVMKEAKERKEMIV